MSKRIEWVPIGTVHRRGTTSVPFPTDAPVNWGGAQEIVLVSWQLHNTPVVDTANSGVYSADELSTYGYLNRDESIDIQGFVTDLNDAAQQGTKFIAPSQGPYVCSEASGASDFVIVNPCYVVLLLEQNVTWRFAPDQPATTTVLKQPSTKYFWLNHVLQDGEIVPNINANDDGCMVAYFSAQPTDPESGCISDYVNYYGEYATSTGAFQTFWFDPAIKNTGHPGLPRRYLSSWRARARYRARARLES